MTITFKDDSDVIIYALEKIISFARERQHLFVASCIWWIASVIGLEQGLVNHIDNLRERKRLVPLEAESKEKDLNKVKSVIYEKAVSATSRDLAEDHRIRIDSPRIHPDRVCHVDCNGTLDHLDSVFKETEEFLQSSKLQRHKFDPLRRTRQGRTQKKKLTKGERKQLNRVIQKSPDSVRKFIQ